MFHRLQLSIAGLVVAWLMLPPPAGAEDTKELKPIATIKANSSGASIGSFELDTTGVVVHSAEELVARTSKAKSSKDPAVQNEMETELAKILKVKAIDWNKQMVLGMITEGFDSLKTDGKILTATFVPYKEDPRAAATRAGPAPPKVLVLIERFEGDVKFVKKKEK
jgi:hypothetical protein